MSGMELKLGGKVFKVFGLRIGQICMIFATNPLRVQYRVLSDVSGEVFRLFLFTLNGEAIEGTKTDFSDFSGLCGEFGFELKIPLYLLGHVEVVLEELKADIEHLSDEITALREISAIAAQVSE
jgi:hypothetical protein